MRLLLCMFLHFGEMFGTQSWCNYTYEESTFTSHTESPSGDARNAQQGARESIGDVKQRDLYSVLGVPTYAKHEEIRKAYMKLAWEYHPDCHSTKSEDEREKMSSKFREVKGVYDTLSDSEERRKYDERNCRNTGPHEANLDDLLKEGMRGPQFHKSFFEFNSSNFKNSKFDTEDFASFRRRFASSFPKRKETRHWTSMFLQL